MTDNFENKVAVDGPVVNEGELGSSTFSPGQVSPAGPLGLGQRWTVTRKGCPAAFAWRSQIRHCPGMVVDQGFETPETGSGEDRIGDAQRQRAELIGSTVSCVVPITSVNSAGRRKPRPRPSPTCCTRH